jgi:hypothetical protein
VLRGGDSFRSRSERCHCEAEPWQSDPKGRCEPEGRGNLESESTRLLQGFALRNDTPCQIASVALLPRNDFARRKSKLLDFLVGHSLECQFVTLPRPETGTGSGKGDRPEEFVVTLTSFALVHRS